MKEMLVYFFICIRFKIQKFIKRDVIKNYPQSDKMVIIDKIHDLYIVSKYKGLQLYVSNNELKDIKVIKAIVKIFRDKEIEIYEKQKILSNNDIRDLAKISRKIYLNSKYMERRHLNARNEVFCCDITTYLMILDKVDFLVEQCNKNCNRIDEKVIFIITQLLKYIKYVSYHDYRTCMANAILLKSGVCVDFAITLYKCMEDLAIECLLVNGISKGDEKDIISKVNIFNKSNHTWNQIKVDNIWYNFDITWFLSTNDQKWLFATDKDFYEDYCHISEQKNNICKKEYNKERLKQLIEKYSKYENYLDNYDKGIKTTK